MLRIAVPLMNKRISPYFGHCDELLLIERKSGRRRHTCQLLSADDPWQISRYLAAIGVKKVVCGGIWSLHKEWFYAHGIEVIDNQCGTMEEVMNLF